MQKGVRATGTSLSLSRSLVFALAFALALSCDAHTCYFSTNTRDSPTRNDRYPRPPPPKRRNLFQTGSGLVKRERRASPGWRLTVWDDVVLRRREWESFVREWTP